MKFIDLFAGLGGFHLALRKLGHECVFASEINPHLTNLYEKNFKIKVSGDIEKIDVKDIPKHDILCAGFPCQPFSKAGKQKGFNDPRGNLLYDIIRVLDYHKPKYFILENVPNIKMHDRERTWQETSRVLTNLGYEIKEKILSPHEFGIPQIRRRIFIVGCKFNLNYFEFPKPRSKLTDIRRILDNKPKNIKKLSKEQMTCLKIWQKIISKIPKKDPLPSFPIWSMEFGATYPYRKKTPYATSSKQLGKTKGAFMKSLAGMTKKKQLECLPSYAKIRETKFPEWKKLYIRENREFFKKHKKILLPYLKELRKHPPSWQKLEWNCNGEKRNIFNFIFQFRPSGIRVKRSNYAPALVANITQRPIIGWEKRYITKREAIKLQVMQGLLLPESENMCFRFLGNAVNVKLVELIAKRLINNKISLKI